MLKKAPSLIAGQRKVVRPGRSESISEVSRVSPILMRKKSVSAENISIADVDAK